METKTCVACNKPLAKGRILVLCEPCLEKGYLKEIEKLKRIIKEHKEVYKNILADYNLLRDRTDKEIEELEKDKEAWRDINKESIERIIQLEQKLKSKGGRG